ncbi:hypothetical protein L1987_50202 [Smallanthus sonchifolius]|uniref:Uncharacterized protein n=1 Tax=Smallanthus sonchifolius TaxID=185202 RepID=A0ACB9FXS3_9ASTR|nr:hypothetical protein L1987_50202 [Smallanthus sonchifolius]
MANCFLLLLLLVFLSICNATKVYHDGRAITIVGQHRLLISGSIHYPRSTPQMWPGLIKKAKDGGVDVIETYAFWNAHEPFRRRYHFSGNLDLIRFIKTIKDHDMYAFLLDMMKQENLFASQGGPIILAQVENEYGNVMTSYGDAAKEYVDWCAKMADSLDIGVPWIMCQQDNAPQPMVS